MSEQTITSGSEVPEVLAGVTGDGSEAAPRRGRGRPRGSKNKVTTGTNGEAGTEAGTGARSTVTVDEINEISLEDISEGVDLAVNISDLLVTMSAPVRKRSERQSAMDAVALRSYRKWIELGRPSAWAKLPVAQYFVLPERVARYNYLIKKACEFVTPEPYDVPVMVTNEAGDEVEAKDEAGNVITERYTAPGVRHRFGTVFTLTPEIIERVNATTENKIPEDYAGRSVISFCAVDKRARATTADEAAEAEDEDEDEAGDEGDE